MPLHSTQYTTMMYKVHVALCEHKNKHPTLSQKELIQWLQDTHNIKVSQKTVSSTLKSSSDILNKANDMNLSIKFQKSIKYPEMESALVEWFNTHPEHVNMSGKLIKEKLSFSLINFISAIRPLSYNGWLKKFKARNGIKSFRRFGESGSVDMVIVENALPSIRQALDKYEWKDIYNMDEIGLFYCMQVRLLSILAICGLSIANIGSLSTGRQLLGFQAAGGTETEQGDCHLGCLL